jgi:ribose transport system substrate-binding protein
VKIVEAKSARRVVPALGLVAAVAAVTLAATSTASGRPAAAGASCNRIAPTGTGYSTQLRGANGEKGVTPKAVTLSSADVAAAKKAVAGKTVAISQHIGTADYTKQVSAGIVKAMTALGAKIVKSDANFNPAKQVSDIENLLTRKPALLVVFPVDQSATVPGIKAANRAGVPVVVVGSALKGGGNYASLVTADNYEGGVIAAQQLVTALKGQGEIAVVPYKFSLWHVDERVRGFKDGIKCTNVKVVESKQTCTNPTDCVDTFANILTAHPNLKGGFGAYDGIALGMDAAAANAGWKGFVTTSDLGLATAQAIKSGTHALQATAVQLTDVQGQVAGKIATRVLAGKSVPKLVFAADAPADKSNVAAIYKRLFGSPLK